VEKKRKRKRRGGERGRGLEGYVSQSSSYTRVRSDERKSGGVVQVAGL